ncbi:hypothetical protein S7S_13825 [Isoalcanivorax pacificus W11-5]|uniref:Lipoprotein n=1 Tax=Isoalcanivorax pacificus W11-5 TaxID=391936 RepID=A0A0B4XSC4_9GAMM|nr:hypothetical protein [Isoalcanivorax pacificus]AJD49177.1 hypothetical protein S7S_13825 [Isoalcanivorax pacificus W11-5]
MGNRRWAGILLASMALGACGGDGGSHRDGGAPGPGPDTLALTLRVSDGQAPAERPLTVRDLGTGARYSLTTDEQGEALFEQAVTGPLVIDVAAFEDRASITGFVTHPDRVAGWVISLSPLAEAIHLAAIGQMLDSALLTDALALPGEALPEMSAQWWLSAEAGSDAAPARVLDALTPVLGRTAARACQTLETADCRNPLAGPDTEDYRNELDLMMAPLDLAGGYTLDEQGVAQFGALPLPLWSGDYALIAGTMRDTAPLVQWALPAYWHWTLLNEADTNAYIPTDLSGGLPVLGDYPENMPQLNGDALRSPQQAGALLAVLLAQYGIEADPASATVTLDWQGLGLTGTRLAAEINASLSLWGGDPVAGTSSLTLEAVDVPAGPRVLSGRVWFAEGAGPSDVDVLSTLLEATAIRTDDQGLFSLTVSGQPLLVRARRNGETLYALVGASEFDSWVNISPLTDAAARSLAAVHGGGTLPESWLTALPSLVAGYYEDIGPLARRVTAQAHAVLAGTGVADDVPVLSTTNPFYAQQGTCPGETADQYCQQQILSALGACAALTGEQAGMDCEGGVISLADDVAYDAGAYMVQTQAMQIITRAWQPYTVVGYTFPDQPPGLPLSSVGDTVRVPLSRQALIDTALAAMVQMSSFQSDPLSPTDSLRLDNPSAFRSDMQGFGDDAWVDLMVSSEDGGEDLTGSVLDQNNVEYGSFTATSLFLAAPPAF